MTDWAGLDSNLQWWDPQLKQWTTWVQGSDTQSEIFPVGQTTVDNFWSYPMQGSGSWQEYTWHHGTVVASGYTTHASINCG